jgi:lipopolysaccharide transport system ATP-binding protein
MYIRLAFAVAAHLDPDILIVDEVLAVGDASFQKRCLGKMQEATEREGRTVLFVSHNMQAVRQMCRRAIFLKEGRVAGDGDPPAVIGAYLGHGSEAEAQSVVDLAAHPRRRSVESGGFERLSFRDGQGRAAMRVNLRDTVEVEVLIRARKPMKQLNVAMAVVQAEGLRVFSEAYSDQHALPDLAPGDYTLRFHVPMRFFKLESYFLVLAMSENGMLCDEIEGLRMPEIIDENPNLQMESHRWGVLRVPVTWDEIRSAVSDSG